MDQEEEKKDSAKKDEGTMLDQLVTTNKQQDQLSPQRKETVPRVTKLSPNQHSGQRGKSPENIALTMSPTNLLNNDLNANFEKYEPFPVSAKPNKQILESPVLNSPQFAKSPHRLSGEVIGSDHHLHQRGKRRHSQENSNLLGVFEQHSDEKKDNPQLSERKKSTGSLFAENAS